jgi:hypothetical protein
MSQALRAQPARRWLLRAFLQAVALAALGVVLVLARAQGIFARYPYLNAWDEGYTVHNAQNMFKFDAIAPNQYIYNPLLMSMTVGLVRLWENTQDGANAAWKFHDSVEPWADFRGPEPNIVLDDARLVANYRVEPVYDIIQPPIFLIAGRVATAAMGLASVLIFFLMLRDFLEFWPALAGAAWLAAIPLFALGNYVVYQEMGILFASLLACLGAQRWALDGRRRWMFLMACGLGMAPGFKSTGIAIACVPAFVLLAHEAPARRKLRDAATLAAASIFFFYFFCPGLLGKEAKLFDNAINGVWVYNQPHYAETRRYWQMALDAGVLGPALLAAAILGMIFGARPGKERLGTFRFALAAFLGVYYGFFSTFKLQAERYVLPTLPLFVYFACVFAKQLAAWIERRSGMAGSATAMTTAAIVAMAIPSAMAGVKAHVAWVGLQDSRVVVVQWLLDRAKPGSRVAIMREAAFHPASLEALRERRGLVVEQFSPRTPAPFPACDAVVCVRLDGEFVSDADKKRLQGFLDKAGAGGAWREAFKVGSSPVNGKLFNPRPNDQEIHVFCRARNLP